MRNRKRELINSGETSVTQVAKKKKEAWQGFFNPKDIKNSNENFLTPEGSISFNLWLTLPEDVWKEIFSHLNPNEATRSARTCKFFNKLKNNDAVLKKQLQNIGYGNDELTGNFTFINKECYLIVWVPDGVISPEDFMKKIIAYKESKQELYKFIHSICKGPFSSEQEGYTKYFRDRNVSTWCLVKIKLPCYYVQYLIADSACQDWNPTKTKPQNFIKIIDSMETPPIKYMAQYLIKQGLITEAEINNLVEAEKINNSSYLVKK